MILAVATVLVLQVGCAFGQTSLDPRITDGSDAAPGEFPYQVSLVWGVPPIVRNRHVCGGSILNKDYALTAGHCIPRVGKLKVVAGKHYVSRSEPRYEQTREVAKILRHPGYKGGVTQHDIALLKLRTPLVFNERVKPLALPRQNERQTGNAVLTGWGSVSKKYVPVFPRTLQKATVALIDNETCLGSLYSRKAACNKRPKLYDTQICSGPVNSRVAACSGDSGGPLVQFVHDVPVQVGIVSWGVFPCGSYTPTVYTRVASYVDWIKQHAAV